MTRILNFVASHDVAIGIAGTIVVILAVIAGYGRHHHAATRTDADKPRR